MLRGAVAIYAGGGVHYVAAAFWAIIDFAFCPCEERRLGTSFPAEFSAYRQRVRRWL